MTLACAVGAAVAIHRQASALRAIATIVAVHLVGFDRQRLMVELNTAQVVAKQREPFNVMELARKQKEAFGLQMELRSKTAEAEA